jgi:DNA modification methylase
MFDIRHGDCREVLKQLPDCSVDSIVTDPPYELGFMGKAWDSTGVAYQVEVWQECLRVLKAGGHLLAFGGSRTYHRLACAIEDAGFQIRDQIMWVYGSGFPKSLNIGKAIDKAAGAEREVIGTVWCCKSTGYNTDGIQHSGGGLFQVVSTSLHLLRLRLNSGKGGEQHSNLLTNRL